MKKKLLNILIVSSIITTVGLVMDGDPVEPSMLMRFVEFFAMIGMVSLLVSFLYFTSTCIFRKVRRSKVS